MNEININIGKLIKNILPEQIEKSLEKASQIVENEAKKKCPVDTGVLRASINHEVDKNEATIGTNVEYGIYVHEAKPFLQDAIDQNIDEIRNCFKGMLEGVKL